MTSGGVSSAATAASDSCGLKSSTGAPLPWMLTADPSEWFVTDVAAIRAATGPRAVVGTPQLSHSSDCAQRSNLHPRGTLCLSQPAYWWPAAQHSDAALRHSSVAHVDYCARDFRRGTALTSDDDYRAD